MEESPFLLQRTAAASSTNNNTASSTVRQEKLREFNNVLDKISMSEKKAYLKAKELCPELIEKESKPLRFLRRYDFHVWNAALAFLGYWESRRELFGEDRAFLPLDLTGKGALTEDDVTAIRTAFSAILPEHHQSGCPVILFCPHNAPALRQDCIARTFFYIRNVVSMNPLAQSHGYLGLIRYSDAWKQMTSGQGMRSFVAALEHMPVIQGNLVLIVKPEDAVAGRAHLQMLRKKSPVYDKMLMLTDSDQGELIQKLQAQGFSPEGLPECMGGVLDFPKLLSWTKPFQNGLTGEDCVIGTQKSRAARQAGTGSPTNRKTAEWGRRVLEETIHLMPENEEKSAYLEALDLVPELVQSESNPEKFLASVDYDGCTAAQKLCKYWFFRKKWFGAKAFLPLSINGRGAMSADDIQVIKEGILQILPFDRQGRSVLVLHSSGLPKTHSIMRALFYTLQKVAESEATQKVGFAVLIHLVDGGGGHIDGAKWTQSEDFVWTAMPMRSRKMYVLLHKGSKSISRGMVIKELFKGDVEIVELASDPREQLKTMLSVGFTQMGIPTEFGGRWSTKNHIAWVNQQVTKEESKDFSLYDESEAFAQLASESVPSGDNTPTGTAEEMTLLVAMEQALKLMGSDKTQVLIDARREIPDLFAVESPPLRFLRAVDFDPQKAAERLAGYWKKRGELFGTRTFLPLDLSGRGALDEKLVRIVKSGDMVLLPKDNEGRPVLFIPKERDPALNGSFEAQLRSFFYLMQVASENPRSQTEGVVVIRKWAPALFLTSTFHRIIDVGAAVLPVRFYSHHVVCSPPTAGMRTYLESITSKMYGFSGQFVTQTTSVHLMDQEVQLKEDLLNFDLRAEDLPTSIGGQWDDESDWQRWITKREAKEKRVSDRLFPGGYPHEKKPGEPVPETFHVQEQALKALREAMNLLPEEDKAAYLEAQRLVPELVLKESNPIWFIWRDKYDPWSAARRLALYWNKRKEYFRERAHLPMNQSGEGALSKEDVALLNTGYCVLLPRDANGRDVVCHDASRKPPGMQEARLRVLFYLGSLLVENRKTITEGNRLLVVLSKLSTEGNFNKTLETAQSALPINSFDVHIVHAPGESKKTFRERLVPLMLQYLGPLFGKTANIHVNESKNTVLERLESYDFDREGLPSSIGGQWTYDKFYYWQEARIRIEWDLPLSTAQRKLVLNGDSYTCRSLSELNEADSAERKRRLNLLHSRRKREKEKVEIEVLKGQVSRLEHEKQESEFENKRLETLVNEAFATVGESFHQKPKAAPAPAASGGLPTSGFGGRMAADPMGFYQGPAGMVGRGFMDQSMGSTNGVYGASPPTMYAPAPAGPLRMQSADQARLQQLLTMQTMRGGPPGAAMAGAPLDYLRQFQQHSQAPGPMLVGASAMSDRLFPNAMASMRRTDGSLSTTSPGLSRNIVGQDAASFAMRLDPNQPIKRQRFYMNPGE